MSTERRLVQRCRMRVESEWIEPIRVLTSLEPTDRAVFVLREAFDMRYADRRGHGEVLGRGAADGVTGTRACGGPAAAGAREALEQQAVVQRSLAALRTGQIRDPMEIEQAEG